MSIDKWRSEILGGVGIIPNTGAVPGTLILRKPRVYSLFTSDPVWIAVTEFGAGRVLVAAHEGYMNIFDSEANEHLRTLHMNIKYWLTKGRFQGDHQVGVLGEVSRDSLSQYSLLIWRGADNCLDVTENDLVRFVQSGGSLIHCMCSWGWLQTHPGTGLHQMPFKPFLDIIGVAYTDTPYFVPESGIILNQYTHSLGDIRPAMIQSSPVQTNGASAIALQAKTWQNEILSGVDLIPHTGAVPGSIVVFGSSAVPILTGENPSEVWIAGAELGAGRVLVVAHESYMTGMEKGDSDMNLKTLHQNMKQWLTKGRYRKNVAVINTNSLRANTKLNMDQIIIWNGQANPSCTVNEIITFVQAGGSFVHTMCPWGWMSLNPGLTIDDIPLEGVLDAVGVQYTARYVSIPQNGLEVARCFGKPLCHIGEALNNINQSLDNMDSLGDSLQLLSDLTDKKFERLWGPFNTICGRIHQMKQCCTPSEHRPVSSSRDKALMSLYEVMCRAGMMNNKLPGVDIFPGDFVTEPSKMSVVVQVLSHTEDFHPTGYYVAPGESVHVSVLSMDMLNSKWTIQIGSHCDCLRGQKQLKRWPSISCSKGIDKAEFTLKTNFGGLIYLKSPGYPSRMELLLKNVIEAPFFDITNPASISDWKRRRNAPGLWADISGEFLTISLPSRSIRHLDNPIEVMKTWDRVLQAHFHLRGSDIRKHRRQWLVTDVQPSAGYMHSGYPVVTHLDVAQPNHELYLLNNDVLLNKGSWGVYHEFGHNMQRDVWTFPGTVEVTTNIFTLHAMDTISGQKIWIHEWLRNQLPNVETYLKYNQDYSKWKCDPGIALFVYAQVAHHLGWAVYKHVFRQYETMNPKEYPTTEQDQIDLWYKMLSTVSGHNLSPLADFWSIPLSFACREMLKKYPPFLPKDEIISMAKERAQNIVCRYPGCVRSPLGRIADEFNNEVPLQPLNYPRLQVTVV